MPDKDLDFFPSGPPGPVTSTISAQMHCKVFLKQQHQQCRNLGAAKLRLPDVKRLIVGEDDAYLDDWPLR